ncbi:hypothetical protein M9H77_07001 [Catharanthus roseus]|uniref:Uncharacterized protein n=1 Tax=Catharanthus roseus TaxID=4058 RepID=A0ACC0BTP9_CATRO|nr:hypothetical protein M9H77_07001 [Catharanthus roseus]
MEAMRKQEDYQSKLARVESMLMMEATMDMETSFLEDMIVMETSLLKEIMELVTSLLMLTYGHTSYDDYEGYERARTKYVEHSPYGYYKGSHDCYDFGYHMSMRGKIKMSMLSMLNANCKIDLLILLLMKLVMLIWLVLTLLKS